MDRLTHGSYLSTKIAKRTFPFLQPTLTIWGVEDLELKFDDYKFPYLDTQTGDLEHEVFVVDYLAPYEEVSEELLAGSPDYREDMEKRLALQTFRAFEEKIWAKLLSIAPAVAGITDISETSFIAGFGAIGVSQILMPEATLVNSLSIPFEAGSGKRLINLGDIENTAITPNNMKLAYSPAFTGTQFAMIKPGAIRYNMGEIEWIENPYNGDKEGIVRFVGKTRAIAVIDPSAIIKSSI